MEFNTPLKSHEVQRSAARVLQDHKDQILEALQKQWGPRFFLNGFSNILLGGLDPISAEEQRLIVSTLMECLKAATDCLDDQKRASDERERASRLKSIFLANTSHEIRTPMSAILGFTEPLHDSRRSTEGRPDAIRRIDHRGRSLLRLLDDILDISNIEAGRLEIERGPFSPLEIATEVIHLMRLSADRKGVSVEMKVQSPLPALAHSDSARIRQMLTNLMGNALKFTPQGKVILQLKADEALGRLQFDVSDTGIGMTPEAQRDLFQPFAQADSSITRPFGATGLGLALSRRLAEGLGGQLFLAESGVGQGSRFTVELPAAPFRYDSGSAGAVHPPRLQESEGLQGVRILVAEDVADNQVLLRRYLSSAGAEVFIAGNGEEAVLKAQSSEYDLILMDIQMPKLDGIQATQQLRARGYRQPILALTAHAMPEEMARSFAAGCNAHLTKPISKQALISELQKHVGNK